jgi:8-oxo-dGTP diphosphatase/2-hydroxy-dATP diphosphatase
MGTFKQATLVFLIKKSDLGIQEICLAMKKRGFGIHRWNGVGGKVEPGETLEEGAKREAFEEILVNIPTIEKVAELKFHFANNPDWDMLVHAYIAESWEGEPTETEEMRPQWYSVDSIPYDNMWPDDTFWLPKVIKGHKLKATFTLGENDKVLEQQINIVDTL